MLMNWKNRTLSIEREYYQEIFKKKKKKNSKVFQNIVAIFKINSIDSRFFVFICRASRICICSLFISCTVIVVFSSRIFWNWDLGIEWVLRCKSIELESLRCIVSCLERVVVVRPTYVLFSLETSSPKGHLNIYTTVCPIKFNGRRSYWK